MRFDSYHPAINFLYFSAVLAGAILFGHPVYLSISLVCGTLYCLKLNGTKGLLSGGAGLLLGTVYTLWYISHRHFGVTVLRTNFIGNRMTLEALLSGISIGLRITAVALWLGCVHAIFTRDKIVYLFGRVSPRLSLFLAILLRLIPRIGAQGKKIHLAQQAIGRGVNQGNIFQRIKNALRLLSILITWTIESFVTSAESMRSRGSLLKGRTAFSIYRFDNRDRSLVIVLFLCLTLTLMAVILGQTYISFDPKIILPVPMAAGGVFYAGYTVLCLLPLGLQITGEQHFRHLQKSMNT